MIRKFFNLFGLALLASMGWMQDVAQAQKPMAARLFHTRTAGGGLIEGACLKVLKDDYALVKLADGSKLAVPLELFLEEEREEIYEHFKAEAPDEPLTGQATDRAEQHPWHSIRGGVVAQGKITAVHDDILDVVDDQGSRVRIPVDLLAQGARAKAEADIALLDPFLVTKTKSKSRSKRTRKEKTAESAKTKSDATAAPPSPETMGNFRKWTNGHGEVVATGKFHRGPGKKIVIVDTRGQETEFALGDLSAADQQYITLVENGARIDPANDSAAISESQPETAEAAAGGKSTSGANAPPAAPDPNLPKGLADAIGKANGTTGQPSAPAEDANKPLGNLRVWKSAAGQTLATGKFRRRTDPKTIVILAENGEETELAFADLTADDRRYVEIAEAGGIVQIADDAAAIRPELKPDEMRQWKMGNGLPLATGKFVELKGDQVVVLQADFRTASVPLELLSESDRQFAQAMASGVGPAKAPEGAIVVESESAKLTASLDGKSLLLLDGATLKILSADGKTILKTHALPEGASQVAERAEYYVVAAGKNLVLLDKETFDVLGNHELWKIQKIRSVALHPKRKVAFLSIENALDEVRQNADERQRIVLIDEKTGKLNMLDGDYATWLLVDPTGEFLMAGYKDVEQEFGGIHINPDGNVIETPEWKNTDILRRYRIEPNGIELDEEFRNAGANGQGLVMSRDGKRIAYLSFTGYPTFSYNIALLDLRDFERKPVTLAAKDVANCKQLALHPTAPMSASPGGPLFVFFDTRSGSVSAKQPLIPDELQGCAVHDFVFSGDGRRLILAASRGGGERFIGAIDLSSHSTPKAAQKAESADAQESGGQLAWTDKSGKLLVEGEFAGIAGKNLRVKKPDGSIVEIPLQQLAPRDRARARKLAAEKK